MNSNANAQRAVPSFLVGVSSILALSCNGVVDYPLTGATEPSGGGGAWPAGGAGQASAAGGAGGAIVVAPGNDCTGVPEAALAILNARCADCHGPGTNTAGFDYVLDPKALRASGKLVPGDALASPLYKRIANGDMPPPTRQQRPSDEELAVIYSWIENCSTVTPMGGAGGAGPGQGGAYFDRQSTLEWMVADLSAFDLEDRRFIRYLSLTHLHNAGVTDEELEVYRYALAKAVNTLSLGTQIVAPQPIDNASTLYRIDLRDYEWQGIGSRSDKWEELVSSNPYAIELLEDEAEVLKLFTGTKVPVQNGDWLVNAATQPPLYYAMLDTPSTLAGLQTLLGLNIARNIETESVWRAGFLDSGVSFQNRVIERHEIPVANFRSLWISYDFASDGGRENIFANPLDFEADGSEIIFSLANGLHGYMIVNAAGQRLDAAPDEIVVDPQQQDRDVRAGISCMSCHSSGIKAKSDELRSYVRDSTDFAFATKQRVLALHPEDAELESLFERDSAAFRAALDALSPPPNMPAEPVVTVFNHFDENVDLKRAAAELGVRPEVLLAELGGLNPALAPLSHASVKRDVFRDAFADTVCRLNIGLARSETCAGSNAITNDGFGVP